MLLAYCPGLPDRLARLRSLYTNRVQDRIFAVMEVPHAAIARFAETHIAGYSPRPPLAERIAFWDDLLRDAPAVHDDYIPCAYLTEQDQGLYGGIAGGAVRYLADPANGWISSMVPPILEDWDGLDRLSLNTTGEVWRYYEESLAAFLHAARGKFGISHFILIDSLNFVFELFGATRTYLEVDDNPERVRQAVDFAFCLNERVQRRFFEAVPLLEGGTCSNMASWLPGRVVSESVDPFHMTSAKYFDRWGREPVERMFAAFDGGVVHLHGNGRHLLPAVSTLRGLKAINIKNDKGYAPAVFELPRLKPQAGDTPLIVEADFPDFVQAFEKHALPGGILFKVKQVPDADTANRWMDCICEYRA